VIRTALCDLLDINLPIVQAPIGSATCPELVAAISNSGLSAGLVRDIKPAAQIMQQLTTETEQAMQVARPG
jgi:nitronate monooxygenase